MKFFNRKNEEEDYEEDIPDRKFRDLKPENKKKRKEPVKPWGKKERLTILLILLITVFLSAGFALRARDYKLPGLPRLSLSFPFFSLEGETIMIEGNKMEKEKADKAISIFKEKTNKLSGVYALKVIRLDSGYSYGVSEKEVMQAASLIKLPVMLTLLIEKPEGYKDLALAMGKKSDNSAFTRARKILTDAKINETIQKIGMTKTNLTENQTTPEEIGLFFEKLYKKELLPEAETNQFLDSITNTIFENWIAAGIPKTAKVSHKYGREVQVVNDAGIVFTEKPFVLVIMTQGVIEREADMVIPELAKDIYEVEIGMR